MGNTWASRYVRAVVVAVLTVLLSPVATAIAAECVTSDVSLLPYGIHDAEVDGTTARLGVFGVDCRSAGWEDCKTVGLSTSLASTLTVDWGDGQATALDSTGTIDGCPELRHWPAQNPTHTYAGPGTYRVRLLRDAEQLSEWDLVIPGPPIAIDVKRSADDPQLVTFTARGEHPSGRRITTYDWDFGDGARGEGPTPTHRYRDTARHTVRLRVTDDNDETHDVTIDLAACTEEVRAGPLTVQGCLYDLEDRWAAVGEIKVNGLATQTVGAAIIKEPLALELKRGTKLLYDGTVVFESAETVRLPADFTFETPEGLHIKGVPVTGQARVRFTAEDGGSALLDFSVDVGRVVPDLLRGLSSERPLTQPVAFLSPVGRMTIAARVSSGYRARLDGASISGDGLAFGPVTAPLLLRRFSLAYRLEDNEHVFEGEAGFGAPLGPLYGARATIRNGRLAKIGGFLDDANVAVPPPAPPGIFWQGGSLDVTLLPSFAVTGQTRLTAGPSIQGFALLSVSGAVTFALDGTCPRRTASGPMVLAEGTGQLVLLAGRRVYACYTAKGNLISAGGDLSYSLGGWKLRMNVDGFLDGTRAAMLTGGGSLTLPLGDGATAQSQARYVVSNVGVAACSDRVVTFAPPAWKGKYGSVTSGVAAERTVRLGIAWRWGDRFPELGCDLARFTTVKARISGRARAAATGDPVTTRVAAGQRGVGFAVSGQRGAPDVTLAAPDGTRIRVRPKGGPRRGPGWLAIVDDRARTTYILVSEPPAGTWSASVAGDRVRSVEQAAFLPPAAVTGTLTRSGAAATLTWKADAPRGQTLRFFEEGDGVAREIGQGTGASGRITFTPVADPGERHRVTVAVEQDGLPRARMDIAPIPATDAVGAASTASVRTSSLKVVSAKRTSRTVTLRLSNPNTFGVSAVLRLSPAKAGQGVRLLLAAGERRTVRLRVRPRYRRATLRVLGTATGPGGKLPRVSHALRAAR